MKKLALLFALFFSLVASHSLVFAASEINTLEKSGLLGKFKDSGTAIRGFDTVAYFTDGKPTKGLEEFSVDWNGATWLFASKENATLFENDPQAYAPQYGGYCAYGVAQGYLVKIEGDQWRIEDGKLYLNYDRGVQRNWLENIPGFIKDADSKFQNLLNED